MTHRYAALKHTSSVLDPNFCVNFSANPQLNLEKCLQQIADESLIILTYKLLVQ